MIQLGGEAIITTGKREMPEIKRACKINEEGNKEYFEDTKSIDVKEYNGKETKFIKSKLPVSRAVKMGASSLKTKPIRLIFTILLSVVAFVMFGVVSTFMLYDKNYSISEALKIENVPSFTIGKSYSYKTCEYTVDLRTGYKEYQGSYSQKADTRFGVQELAEKNRAGVSNYAGIFDFTDKRFNLDTKINLSLIKNNQEIGISVSSKMQNYYVEDSVCGFSDCGAQYMSDNGFELIIGEYPQDKNQIAIPEYIADLFINTESSGITSISEMRGKTIKIIGSGNNVLGEFVVSGIYNVGKIPNKYQVLKDDSNDLDLVEKQKLINSLSEYLKLSYNTIIYVSSDFYDAYQSSMVRDYEQHISYKYCSGLNLSNTEMIWPNGSAYVLLESMATFYND